MTEFLRHYTRRMVELALEQIGDYWPERNFGAGDRDRTGDVQLGKLAFYR